MQLLWSKTQPDELLEKQDGLIDQDVLMSKSVLQLLLIESVSVSLQSSIRLHSCIADILSYREHSAKNSHPRHLLDHPPFQ